MSYEKIYIENPGESGFSKNNRMVGVEDISTIPILHPAQDFREQYTANGINHLV